jgi:translation initiation factor 3 subunit B
VYETDTFILVDKKSYKVDNVVDFSWSPTDPIFALFVPELGGGNQPARVSYELRSHCGTVMLKLDFVDII